MISASTEFIQALQDNHTFKVKIEATLTDGTQLTIENPNIKMDSMSFEKAVSGDSTFDIGSFIVGKLSLTLNNIPGTYNGLDFDGAVFSLYFANRLNNALYPSDELYPGTDLYPGEIISQYVLVGTYTVIDTDGQNGAWIAITAYDNACRFQAPLSDVNVTFPTTAYSLVSAICSHVGVTAATIPNTLANITISALGEDVEPNCLQAIAWCAMLIGTNATINPSGQLTFMWYDTTTLSSVRVDIETNGWDSADLSAVHELTGLIDVRTMVDDVTITGVAVTYNDADGTAVTTPISGSTGYVINVAENALVTADNVNAVLANLASALVGMTFRPFEVTMMSNPLFEPGDIVWFHNRKGQKFLSVITSLSSPVGNHMTLLCGAETPKRQSAMDYSATTRVIQQAKSVAVKALGAANSAADVANATRQYFWHDTNGVHVADEANNATSTRNTLWNSLGMLFRKGANVLLGILTGATPMVAIYDGEGNTDDHIVASFGADGAVVGYRGSTHTTITPDSFAVSNYDGTETVFEVDGRKKAVTLGNRNATGTTGQFSATFGTSNIASAYSGTEGTDLGNGAIAHGVQCTASGVGSLAGGNNATSGINALAHGNAVTASGRASTAFGLGTIANNAGQTVVGKYNVEDTNGDYAFIVGNGSASARSNAFAVTWNGDIVFGKSPISVVPGSSVSLASNTATTVAYTTLDKGNYILTGVCRFAANTAGHRTLLFSASGDSVSAYDMFAIERIGASQNSVTYMQISWPVEIAADNTTVYLNAIQNSGGALTVDNTGIKIARIG